MILPSKELDGVVSVTVWGIGAGNQKTKIGAYLRQINVTQGELSKASGVNQNTLSAVCRDPDYVPSSLTRRRLIHGLRTIGHMCNESDFW